MEDKVKSKLRVAFVARIDQVLASAFDSDGVPPWEVTA
jgi:hypothetical protein